MFVLVIETSVTIHNRIKNESKIETGIKIYIASGYAPRGLLKRIGNYFFILGFKRKSKKIGGLIF